jgi:glutathione S-transferase
MQLLESDIRTREVLGWKGLHLLNAPQSSCSQKLRIFLDEKGIVWESHPVNLGRNENITPWFLGINPRGVVPVLVHDGAVHIESNDILLYLEALYPTPRLIPAGAEGRIEDLLRHEDDLHFDLRNLSFRFVFAPPESPKSEATLATYATAGSGEVGGRKDAGVDAQIDYWRRYRAEGGISDATARASTLRFRAAFAELDTALADHGFLIGDDLTVVDIAWFIYVDRLTYAGYPFARLHPRLSAWFARLSERPAFARERAVSGQLRDHVETVRAAQGDRTLAAVAGI